MSRLRLYVDEDACEHAVTQALRARNVDILTTIEANRLGSDDPSQLAFATMLGRAIYTFNVADFAKLHHQYLNQNKIHASIIVIPSQRYSIGQKIHCIAEFASRIAAVEMINRMEYL